MPHIVVDENLPGIRALMAFRPETAAPMNALAEILLRDDEGLSRAERELIAAFVSYRNDCFYCHTSHGEIAACYLGDNRALVEQVKQDFNQAPVSDKLKALLHIAGKVQVSGKQVTAEDVAKAKALGASDRDVHDTVLIAAAFCMFNRYVDGLAATAPTDMASYPVRARQVVELGYGSHIYTPMQRVTGE